MSLPPETVTMSWETVATIVGPICAGALAGVKWIISRSDRDRDALLTRMDMDRQAADEDRRTLRDSLHALKNVAQTASISSEAHEQTMQQVVQAQQRIVWTQERILALIESDLKIAHARENEVV